MIFCPSLQIAEATCTTSYLCLPHWIPRRTTVSSLLLLQAGGPKKHQKILGCVLCRRSDTIAASGLSRSWVLSMIMMGFWFHRHVTCSDQDECHGGGLRHSPQPKVHLECAAQGGHWGGQFQGGSSGFAPSFKSSSVVSLCTIRQGRELHHVAMSIRSSLQLISQKTSQKPSQTVHSTAIPAFMESGSLGDQGHLAAACWLPSRHIPVCLWLHPELAIQGHWPRHTISCPVCSPLAMPAGAQGCTVVHQQGRGQERLLRCCVGHQR